MFYCPQLFSEVRLHCKATLSLRNGTVQRFFFKHLKHIKRREKQGNVCEGFWLLFSRQCEVAVSMHGSVTALRSGILKSLCSEERASKRASGEPSFSSFYRKGLNSWRQTEPLLYLTGYHKHSCMLHAYCKCVQLDGRVCKHKDTTLHHMPKQA